MIDKTGFFVIVFLQIDWWQKGAIMELVWKLLFVAMLLVVSYPAQANEEIPGGPSPTVTADDEGETIMIFVVVVSDDDGASSCDDCCLEDDDGTRGIVVYDPDDLAVLNVVLVGLTDLEPWFYDVIEAFCPVSIRRECGEPVYNGGAGDWGGGEVILYTVDDLRPLEEAVILLLEKFPLVLADESAWACGCK